MRTLGELIKSSENKLQGIAAAPGLVVGKAYIYNKEKIEVQDSLITNVEEAINNFNEALAKSKKELHKVFELAKVKIAEERAAIFEAQLMILDDPILIETIINRIKKEKRQPEFIVHTEINKYQELMLLSNESYMQERAHDINDIKERIIRNLQKKRLQSKITNEVIVVSNNLTPADTILFSRCDVRGFVMNHGGLTSHAAIISRSLNIPAVLGTHNATEEINDGDIIVVDGFYGYVIINPTVEQLKYFNNKIERLKKLQSDLNELVNLPAVTKDGREIKLLANVDVTGEIDLVVGNGAKGIGLYRTEQIIAELGEFPDEEEQTKIYKNLASRIYPDLLTIRAFDIGGDKINLLNIKESNPFLGLRGIRFLLEHEHLFKIQIRAVLKASYNKNVQFMLPMITTISEINKSKKLIEDCKKELKKEKIPFDNNIKIGIMIEVPSAALMAREFATEVDFLSIGTNDLIQYLLAVDRGNDLVSYLYQEFDPAIIRTINYISKEGKKGNVDISLCGEMAADTLAVPILVGMGLDSLSVSPSVIPYLKRIIRSLDYNKSKELAAECLKLTTETEVAERIKKFFEDNNITRTRNII